MPVKRLPAPAISAGYTRVKRQTKRVKIEPLYQAALKGHECFIATLKKLLHDGNIKVIVIAQKVASNGTIFFLCEYVVRTANDAKKIFTLAIPERFFAS